ncbi:MAG: tetratricopeptide repeat protein [Armatimonadota bacterium]
MPGQDTDRLEPASEADEAEQTLVMDASPDGFEEDAGAPESLLHEASELLAAGDADAAAVRCREAIERAPDLVAAYSLLGMAEEQRGNTVAAAGAYRRVLQLEPGRAAEREKLELLYERGEASRPEADGLAQSESPVLRWAPWVAAAGAAFVVLVILTLVGVYLHAGWAQERLHAEQMEIARAALDSGDYARAREAFEAALRVRPEDRDAQQGLRYARRKLQAATSERAQAVRPIPSPRIVSSSGPNPFQPIPIGGDDERPEPQPQQPTQTTRAPRPPVVTSERVRSSDTSSSGSAETEVVPFSPLEGPAGSEETASDESQEEGIPDGDLEVVSRPQGTVHIEFVDRPPAAEAEREQSEPQPQPSAEEARRAASLRAQADEARRSGDCARAAELYRQAMGAYREDMEANPGNREADQAAIEACERARNLCTTGEGQ